MRNGILSIAVGLAIYGTSGGAHHSIAGAYDTTTTATIEGVVAAFQFINPHPLIDVDVRDTDGTVQTWRLELDNRHEVATAGMTARTLDAGDRVIVVGSPSRTEPRRLYVRRLDRPADGLLYEQVGSRPRVRVPIPN